MSCYKPLEAYQYCSGGPIMFNRPTDRPTNKLEVNCRQCIGCKIQDTMEWTIRSVHESKLHDSNYFLTLTYSDEFVPWDNSLSKPALQKFNRKLRKACGKFRFYAVGEYGERTSRPHYHGNYFGLEIPDVVQVGFSGGYPIYQSDIVDRIWKKGFVTIGAVTPESCAYTAKYLTKDDTWKDNHEWTHFQTGEIIQREKPFRLMSRRPGLGYEWYRRYETDFFPSDSCVDSNGNERPAPEYYRQKLKETDIDLYEAIRDKRVQALKSPLARWNRSADRLVVREQCALARTKGRSIGTGQFRNRPGVSEADLQRSAFRNG